ncbi:MAG: hypothetical protein ACFHWX_23170 [Bacteroidota bacterium]
MNQLDSLIGEVIHASKESDPIISILIYLAKASALIFLLDLLGMASLLFAL